MTESLTITGENAYWNLLALGAVSRCIISYDVVVPNKVILVTFADGKTEKLICSEEDTFDLKKGLYIAIAKHKYKDEFTLEGIEAKAKEISYTKKYVKMVNKAIREHDRATEEQKKAEEKQREEKKRAHEKRMKNAKKNRERKIQIQKDAYLFAMREFQADKKNKK